MYFTAITSCLVINRILHVWWNGALVATLSTSHNHIICVFIITHIPGRKQWTWTITVLNQHLYLFYRNSVSFHYLLFHPFYFRRWFSCGIKAQKRENIFLPFRREMEDVCRLSEKDELKRRWEEINIPSSPVQSSTGKARKKIWEKSNYKIPTKTKKKRWKRRSKQNRYLQN